jgi:uncharacterized protein YndB with AHSA1/START domain
MSTKQTTAANGFTYTLSRTLGVPAASVWRPWSTAEQYAQWAKAVAGSVEMDVRRGDRGEPRWSHLMADSSR